MHILISLNLDLKKISYKSEIKSICILIYGKNVNIDLQSTFCRQMIQSDTLHAKRHITLPAQLILTKYAISNS